MRLIVHMGLHKTASTYLQHILNANSGALEARGLYYEPQEGYPAHHHAAWALLAGDHAPLERMILAARARRCHTLILSSEDLEGLVVNPALAAGIERAALAMEVGEIEWHACLREPGAYFQSLFAQLQHHVYADSLALFVEAMKRGLIFIPDPHAGEEGTPYWAYCFDYARHLAAFRDAVSGTLVVHDYRDAAPFPGWRMLDRLGALDAVTRLPGEEERNARLSAETVQAGYLDRIAEAIGPEVPLSEALCAAVEQALGISADHVSAYAATLSARFAPSYETALGWAHQAAAAD